MFINRNDAGQLLAKKLNKYKNSNGVVLAIPRGGVPLGFIIASELGLSLDIILSKKIGHPSNKEFAIGSVTLFGFIFDEKIPGVSGSYITQEAERIQKELSEKHKKFMGNRNSIDFKGKIVIVVDDGIATGNTLLVALDSIKKHNPKKIIIAVPVVPPETANRFRNLVDEFECLLEPENFSAIGEFYSDFSQVSDDEVISLLSQSEIAKS